jgi:hypothetical protein
MVVGVSTARGCGFPVNTAAVPTVEGEQERLRVRRGSVSGSGKGRATNGERQTESDKQRATNRERQTESDKQRATKGERQRESDKGRARREYTRDRSDSTEGPRDTMLEDV